MFSQTTDKYILNASSHFIHKKDITIIETTWACSDIRTRSEDTAKSHLNSVTFSIETHARILPNRRHLNQRNLVSQVRRKLQ